jgi:alkanesulfonate monooxygenase SsuD/methylene tetrahydromethanopterin reductase-like flavin-dependent oxidoreductase (luciferase family)
VLDALGAWTSQTSLRFMAERGLHPITTPNKTMESWLEDFELFQQIREENGFGPANRPVLESPMYCCESEQEAREGVEQFFGEYVDSVIRLYEIGTDHFATGSSNAEYQTQGSDYGDGTAEDAKEVLTKKLLRDGIWGTPEQCVEKVIDIHETADPSELILFLGTGSMTGSQVQNAMRLFGEKALPRLAHLRTPREAVAAV